MSLKLFATIATALLTFLAATANASDDYNIDFGDLSLSTPDTYGGAAAKPGSWNFINSIGTVLLVDTTGGSGEHAGIRRCDSHYRHERRVGALWNDWWYRCTADGQARTDRGAWPAGVLVSSL